MMRLLRAELGRFRSRSLVWVVTIVTLAIAGFVVANAYVTSRPPSDAEVAQQQKFFDENFAMWETEHEVWYQDCLAGEAIEREASGDPTLDWDCEANLAPPVFGDWIYRSMFSDQATSNLSGYLQLLLGGAFLIGASLLAAEAATGNLGLWLTFEPRRSRVLASKLTAVALGSLAYCAIGAAVLLAGTTAATALNDALDATPELWRSLTLMTARGVALGVVAGALGGAFGALLRHTAAALGVLFGYLVVVEVLVRNLVPTLQPWLVLPNLTAVLHGTYTVYWEKCPASPETGQLDCTRIERTLTLLPASILLSVLTAAVLAVTWLVFRRRDVS